MGDAHAHSELAPVISNVIRPPICLQGCRIAFHFIAIHESARKVLSSSSRTERDERSRQRRCFLTRPPTVLISSVLFAASFGSCGAVRVARLLLSAATSIGAFLTSPGVVSGDRESVAFT